MAVALSASTTPKLTPDGWLPLPAAGPSIGLPAGVEGVEGEEDRHPLGVEGSGGSGAAGFFLILAADGAPDRAPSA